MKLLIIMFAVIASAKTFTIENYGTFTLPKGSERPSDALIEEFNAYDHQRLVELSNMLLNGILDTSLSPDSMAKEFVKTSGLDWVKVSVIDTVDRFLGFYRPSDSTLVLCERIENKELFVYVLYHELAHAIQSENGFMTYGRKTVIVNELFADYIASIHTGYCKYRQDSQTLSVYIDTFWETQERLINQRIVIWILYMSITKLLEE